MDTTKDIIDEEENNIDVATEQPNTNTTNTINNTSATSFGLQQIDDNNDLPLSMGAAEVISNTAEPPKQIGKVEQINDNDLGPQPPVAMLEESLNATDPDVVKTISNNISSTNDDELAPPVPFNSAQFERDTIAKKKAKDELNQQVKPAVISAAPPLDRDSVYESPREVIEGNEGMSDNTNAGRGDTNRRGWEDIESRVAHRHRDLESQTCSISINNDSIVDAEANIVPTSTNQGLPEAYLVEDVEEEVFIATPVVPWWKRPLALKRRTKILFGGLVVLALIVAVAVLLFFHFKKTCFGADDGGYQGILYFAIRDYVRQDCANNKECDIGQKYGWPMNSWCVGSVTDMSDLFSGMDTFNEDINGWNTSSVTDMTYMFNRAISFNQDVSNFDTSSVTNMFGMFWYATSFNGDVSNFDTSNVTDMDYMFADATSFNGDVSNFNISSVTNMEYMFHTKQPPSIKTCPALTSQVLRPCTTCSRVRARSIKIYVHGKIAFHTQYSLMISSQNLVVHIKIHQMKLKKDPFVLQIVLHKTTER